MFRSAMMLSDQDSRGRPPVAATPGYRQLILALIAIGAAGLLGELLLLEHYEDPWQWVPLVLLALTLLTSGGMVLRPSLGVLRVFQLVMLACVAFGAIGVFLHLSGNLEFELESTPSLRGWPLYREVIRGAVPALAPGALAQIGLLGLLYAYRHPAGSRPAGTHASPDQELS